MKECKALFFHVLAQAERRLFWQDLLQGLLAPAQGLRAEVMAIRVQQIEDIVDEAVSLAGFERRLQRREARNTVLILDHDLAVDQRRAHRELADR